MINFTMLASRRPRLLKQALDSLGPAADMKVLVLADNASPETLEVLRASGVAFEVNEQTLGTGGARNRVIQLAERGGRGDYLYLSDDDVCFHAGWASTLTVAYEEAWKLGFRVLGAYNHPYHIPIARIPLWNCWQVHEVQALALQSMLMRWEVWDKYGPFHEVPPGAVCQGEDGLFCDRVKADGGRVGVVGPALLVNTGITNSFGQPIPGADLVRAQAPQGVYIE